MHESKMTQSSLDYIRQMKGNHRCIDCNYPQPDWASVSFGVLFCIDCSGKHRSLGVHIDFVRSLLMDSWDEKQVSYMMNGGNDSYKEYLKQNGFSHLFDPVHDHDGDAPLIYTDSITREIIIRRYDNHAACNYKAILKARVEGQPIPSEHPESAFSSYAHTVPPTSTSSDGGSSEVPKRVMMGFGSDPTYDPTTGRYLEESSDEQGLLTTRNILIALSTLAIITGFLLWKQHGR
jgi:hypothetical protein